MKPRHTYKNTCYFHGNHKNSRYFEGWYCKQEARQGTVALIPSFHADTRGVKSASLQVITDDGAWSFSFPAEAFFASRQSFFVRVGDNFFSARGISLNLHRENFSLTGSVRFSPFCEPRTPMMGPFRFLPFLQCSHDVLSMRHRVCGRFVLNGKVYDFENTSGYIESDRGDSFPVKYFWMQTFSEGGQAGKVCRTGDISMMAAAATIPLPGGLCFTGFLCNVRSGQKEYRMATYRGARVVSCTPRKAVIRQGNTILIIDLAPGEGFALNAPLDGAMGRTITERISAPVRCRFFRRGVCLLTVKSRQASTEYVG